MRPFKRRPGETTRPCLNPSRLLHAGLAALLLCLPHATWAQPGSSTDRMPPWTVLALKLVSATHVQPTTGIVIGAPDRVLVAIDFAREGDEIMVLDGGTDIVRHGRPATIVHTLPADKLAILKVQGLVRPAARLSGVSPAELKSLGLVAFPPAEMIAQGQDPVRAEVKTLAAITTHRPTLEPFPNVSGALTDACGNLVAYNLAIGVQDMQPAGSPRLAWSDALQRAATEAGTVLQTADCSPAQPVPEPVASEQATRQEEAGTPLPTAMPGLETESTLDADEPETTSPDAAGELPEETSPEIEAAGAADEPLASDVFETEGSAIDGQIKATGDGQGAAIHQPAQLITHLLVIASLLALAVLAWWFYRRQRQPAATATAAAAQQSSPEPDTVRFETAANRTPAVVLAVSGHYPDGGEFSIWVPVSGPEWSAEFGRQDADISLENATVSRRHARLRLHQGRLVLSDLDSTNGTRVNGIPCLPGEEFFVQAEDSVDLGEVSLRLQLASEES